MTPANAGGNAGPAPDFALRAHPGYVLINDNSPGMPRSERPGVTVRIIITKVST
jgi:hypothetical protein